MPQFDTNVPHPVQLALWGDASPLGLSIENCAGIVFDVANMSIGDSTDHDRPQITRKLRINGLNKPYTRYPMFREFRKNPVVDSLPSFNGFPTRAKQCPYCCIGMLVSEWYEPGTEEQDRAAGQLLEHCANCTFWQVHGFRMQCYEARSTLFYDFDVSVLSSKVREFDTDTPEGSLTEVSQ